MLKKMFSNMIENVTNMAPIVHNITNYVTVNDCANVLLACGASPIMADDVLEVEEITGISKGLVINIGTLNSRTIEAMIIAGRKANESNIPVILDPVGAGASQLRTDTTFRLLREVKFSVIRGNISEINTIHIGSGRTKGVDADVTDKVSRDNIEKVIQFARELSTKTGAIIAITGEIDIVTDYEKTYLIYNGHVMMGKITGTGCMLSSLIGGFCAANPQTVLEATATAVCMMGLCGELAYKKMMELNGGTSSLKMYLIDFISKMDAKILETGAKIEEKSRNTLSFIPSINQADMRLYLVTDRTWLGENTLVAQVEAAIRGGATFIQLREKELEFEEFVKIAKEIKAITDQYGIPFVINDNVEVAIEVNADGVHIGQSDEALLIAREKLGSNKIIGVSAHNVEEAIKAQINGADYIGVGAVFPTNTKHDAKTVLFDILIDICQSVEIPVVAIGGITKDNLLSLSGSGVDGVAVISAILAQKDILKATEELLELSKQMVKSTE